MSFKLMYVFEYESLRWFQEPYSGVYVMETVYSGVPL